MPKKILLADDSITIQKVVELTFSDGDYEVVAVNNGARAIDKLGEIRPDIILSDIIMPERNGYEVCEFVKSHPSLRSIPVILLTGTFEPFDPDRAEKAGCDAVVTKPFESQNLIHKVEELIASSAQQAPAPEPVVEAPPPPPVDMSSETRAWHIPSMAPAYEPPQEAVSPFAAPPSFSTQETPFEIPAAEPPPVHEAPTDVFQAPVLDSFAAETRAFPAMGFDQVPEEQPAAPEPPPMFEVGAPEPPPAFAPAPLDLDGSTRAVPALEFDRIPTEKQHAIPEEPAPAAPVFSLDEPQEQQYAAETRAFPVMSFDQMQALQQAAPQGEQMFEPPAEEPAAPAIQDEVFAGAEEPAFSAETRAFPAMSFDEMQALQQAAPAPPAEELWSAPAEEPAQQPAEPEWGAPAAEEPAPAWSAPAEAPAPEEWSAPAEEPAWSAPAEPEPAAAEPEWSAPAAEEPAAPSWEAPAEEPMWGMNAPAPAEVLEQGAPESEPEWAKPATGWGQQAVPEIETPVGGLDESALLDTAPEPPAAPAWSAPAEPEPAWSAPAEEQPETPAPEAEPPAVWSEPAAEEEAPAMEPVPEPEQEPEPEPAWSAPAVEPAAPAIAAAAASIGVGELTKEQIDAIARRVIEMMSEDVVRKIAWEVVPEVADMIVRERIKELESAE